MKRILLTDEEHQLLKELLASCAGRIPWIAGLGLLNKIRCAPNVEDTQCAIPIDLESNAILRFQLREDAYGFHLDEICVTKDFPKVKVGEHLSFTSPGSGETYKGYVESIASSKGYKHRGEVQTDQIIRTINIRPDQPDSVPRITESEEEVIMAQEITVYHALGLPVPEREADPSAEAQSDESPEPVGDFIDESLDPVGDFIDESLD